MRAREMALPAAVITLFIGCLYLKSELSRLEAFARESTLSAGSKLLENHQSVVSLQAELEAERAVMAKTSSQSRQTVVSLRAETNAERAEMTRDHTKMMNQFLLPKAKEWLESRTASHWSSGLEYENFKLVPCPTSPDDHPLFTEIAGQCVSPDTLATGGMVCNGLYGVLWPQAAANWGRAKIDWDRKVALHSFAPEQKFDVVTDLLAPSSKKACVQTLTRSDTDYAERMAHMYAGHTADRRQFVMIEVGAGYFKWLLDAHNYMRINYPDTPVTLIGMESEPMTAEWARMTVAANGVKGSDVTFLKGVAGVTNGDMVLSRVNTAMSYGGHVMDEGHKTAEESAATSTVTQFSLTNVLQSYWIVDHIDMDCNGCEIYLFADMATNEMLVERVRTMFIETHNEPAHDMVVKALKAHGWTFYWQKGYERDPPAEGYLWVKNPNFDSMVPTSESGDQAIKFWDKVFWDPLWDQLLPNLKEMGFKNEELNKQAVAENSGDLADTVAALRGMDSS